MIYFGRDCESGEFNSEVRYELVMCYFPYVLGDNFPHVRAGTVT